MKFDTLTLLNKVKILFLSFTPEDIDIILVIDILEHPVNAQRVVCPLVSYGVNDNPSLGQGDHFFQCF